MNVKKQKQALATQRKELLGKQEKLHNEYCKKCVVRKTTPNLSELSNFCERCHVNDQLKQLGDAYVKNINLARSLRRK